MTSPPAGGARQVIKLQRCLVAVAALFAFDGTAVAKTIGFEGEYGLNRQQPPVADEYDANGATVRVEQGTSNACWNIRNPDNRQTSAVFTGGRCIGVGDNRTMTRKPLYDQGNGAAIRSEIYDFTVRRFYSEYAWDPLKGARANRFYTAEEVWIEGGRDDCLEMDNVPHHVKVRRSMIVNCHMGISVRPGGGGSLPRNILIDYEDSILSLGCFLDDNAACLKRDTRASYPWARKYSGNMDPNYTGGTGGRSVGQFFKVRNYDQITVRFVNNHVAMGATPSAPGPDGVFWTNDDILQENGFHTAERNLDFFHNGPLNNPKMKLHPDSTGNTFYWLGGCDFRGLTMVQLHGACVPKEFNLDPKVWTAVSNSWGDWLAARNRFIDVVWAGNPDPGPDPDPDPDPDPGHEPDPDPDPDPAPDPAPTEVTVALDMRPQQCPNQARLHRTGTMPVAIAGTDGVNVRDIDLESIRLAGVAPQLNRTHFQDLVTPFEPFVGKRDKKDCTRDGADGFEDVLLRFSVPALSKALGSLPNKAVVVVRLTGKLEDGTPIKGEDVIVVNN